MNINAIDSYPSWFTYSDELEHMYKFEEAEDWLVGDGVNLIISDNGTFNDKTDDIILSVSYTG